MTTTPKWLLVVTGKDRPGIIAGVTEVLYRAQCNLEDISMTILEGVFAMIVVTSIKVQKKRTLDQALARLGAHWNLSFDWKPVNQSINLTKSKKNQDSLYLISAMGRDRTGIVYEISQELARRRLNVQDLNSRVLGSGAKAVYAMVLEVSVPPKYPVSALTQSLEKIGKHLKIEVNVKPVEQLDF